MNQPTPAQQGIIGGYRLVERIGEGGMGEVWRARHTMDRVAAKQGGDVAVKILYQHHVRHKAVRERYEREVEIGLSLQHPGIVRCLGMINHGEYVGIVMELVEGDTLEDLLDNTRGPTPWIQAWPIFEQVLQAVDYAHRHGVVHRDLKPANIMVDRTGRAKVLDFGIARRRESKMTRLGSGMGTVDYMAPEQWEGAADVDERADLYALGMTLYEVLAGRLPWEANTTDFDVHTLKRAGRMRSPSDFYPHIPRHAIEAIRVATRPARGQRFRSVEDFHRALEFDPRQDRAPSHDTVVLPLPDLPATPGGLFWSLDGRLSRKGWFEATIRSLGIVVAGFALAIVVSRGSGALASTVVKASFALCVTVQIRLLVQRIHDLGHSGWLLLMALVFPPLGAYVLLAPGEDRENDYGPPASGAY